jgi:benzoate/toluate 1,2-dioxygenase beta subunit
MSIDFALMAQVGGFLGYEAGLLDRQLWHEWLALFAPEGRLWAPAWMGDDRMTVDPVRQLSLIYADKRELEARIFRLEGADSYASSPLPLTAHAVTCTEATHNPDGTLAVEASWFVHSFWRTRGAVSRGGRYRYTLQPTDGSFLIQLKTVFIHDDRVTGPLDIYNI